MGDAVCEVCAAIDDVETVRVVGYRLDLCTDCRRVAERDTPEHPIRAVGRFYPGP